MTYENLDAWKGCHALALAMLTTAKHTVNREPWLIRRLCDHAVASAGKLAFGSGTRNRRMFRQAVARSAGHLSAFGYHLGLARVMGILPEKECTQLDALRGRAAFYTWQLLESLLAPRNRGDPGTG